MKVTLSQLVDHRSHLLTGVVVGLLVGLLVTVLSPTVTAGGIIVMSLFVALACAVVSRSLAAYARTIKGDDDGDL